MKGKGRGVTDKNRSETAIRQCYLRLTYPPSGAVCQSVPGRAFNEVGYLLIPFRSPIPSTDVSTCVAPTANVRLRSKGEVPTFTDQLQAPSPPLSGYFSMVMRIQYRAFTYTVRIGDGTACVVVKVCLYIAVDNPPQCPDLCIMSARGLLSTDL